MSKTTGTVTFAFKQQLRSTPGEMIEVAILIILVFIGILVSVLEFLGHGVVSPEHAGYLTLGLVGFLALHFCIERFTVMRRVEGKVTILPWITIVDFDRVRSLVERLAKLHNDLRKLQLSTKRVNPGFKPLAQRIIDQHDRELQALTEGKWSVPRAAKLSAHLVLMKTYKKSFKAISHNDLSYWIEPHNDAKAYLRDTGRLAAENGTRTSRIFVLQGLAAIDQQLIKVLQDQEKAGIGWAVAIVGPQDARLDCALYDENQAVSLFRQTEWTYETIFATTPENKSQVQSYKQRYDKLVPECWLASKRFVDTHTALRPNIIEAADRTQISARVQELAKKAPAAPGGLPRAATAEESPTPAQTYASESIQ